MTISGIVTLPAWVTSPVLAPTFVFIPASQPGGVPLNEVFIVTIIGVSIVSIPASQSGGIVCQLDLRLSGIPHLMNGSMIGCLSCLLYHIPSILDIFLHPSKYALLLIHTLG